jgi:MFS family permease
MNDKHDRPPPSLDRGVGVTTRPGAATRTADRPCIDCLDPAVAVAKPAWRLSRPVAFWLIAYAFAVTMLGTTLPTPLYVIYQAQWHFSTSLITLIFASYAVAVLAALLLAGRSSDQVGRRPVLAAAICLSIVSAVTFILAPGVGWLFLGRVLSGLSAGLMTGTATAALTETARPGSGRRASLVSSAANLGGLALGPLLAGLLAQWAPEPTVLPFVVQLGLVAVAGLGLLVVPETVSGRSALSLRFHGFGIPEIGRAEFLAAGLAGFAAFSLLGLFSALVPTFLVGVLHDTSHAVAGAVVFLVFAVGACTQLAGSRLPSRPVILAGLVVFLAALALIVAGLSAASMPLFLAGAVVSGVAIGTVFMGSLATANRLAPAETRGQVISTYFVFAYVGLTVPVIAVGFGAQAFGDFRATLTCAIALAVIAVASMATIRRPAG